MTTSQVNDLTILIARMQKNADTVEKDVLRTEDLLDIDDDNDKRNRPFKHQNEISDCLSEAEELLKDLFLDLNKAKEKKHPQAFEIEKDVSRLHERWLKDCAFYRDLYKQIYELSLQPRFNWIRVFNQKEKEVSSEAYGPTIDELVKQIAAHNILQIEIETYNMQLSLENTTSQEEYAALKKQYTNLLDNSKWRHHYLNSLYEYIQRCNKEVSSLKDEQAKILQQDWSDRKVDPPNVRRRYEIFKNNSLLSHESEVNKLQDDGDRLIEMKHPAASTIQSHRDTLRNEWRKFLNLCTCQETHLDNVEEYKKFQLDAENLSKSLTTLNSTLDPESLYKTSNTETQLQLEIEEGLFQRCEQALADLRMRSTTIAPLKLRHTTPNRPITIQSVCDWSTHKAYISRDEKFTLMSNSDYAKWDVQSTNGAINSFPGVCFVIPPPDTEAIDRVDLIGKELDDLKKRRAALRASLKSRASETSQAGSLFKPLENPKVTELSGCLGKNQQEEDDCYPMTKRPLGYCLIINNYIFKDGSKYNYRKGTDADKDALFSVFSRMHFSVVERRDLASSDMMKAVKEFAEMDHSKMDVFVCCILSHGEKGTVIGSDCEPVQIRDLTQHFAQCPTLTGKPKIFFIQACQGNELQRGVWTQDGFEEEEEYEDDSKKNSLSRIPIEADFLIGMSTVESYKSFRHTTDGSIFIQELCRQLTNGCHKREDILSILTKVNCKVGAQDLNGKKQMPEPRYTLTRKLVLPMD